MFNNVDLIGLDAVAKMIEQTNLKRFIIYRQGAAKGSTPVYDSSYTQTNNQAIKSFKDWAANIVQFNPNNFLCYDILLFDDFEDAEGGADAQNKAADENKTGRKKGKVRMSFALNASMQNMPAINGMQNFNSAPQINVADEIAKGVQLAMLTYENKQLKEKLAELEEEEEEEEESAFGGDVLGKISNIMTQINTNNAMQNAGAMAGDELDEKMTAQKNKYNFTPAEIKVKNENINKALKVLWSKDKNLDTHLLKLASIAQSNDILYKMLIEKLKTM